MSAIKFDIQKKDNGSQARAGTIRTSHGDIQTPAFAVVGTKGTVKTLSPEGLKELGASVVLANTYHLYLQPGTKLIKKHGGLGKFMNWEGPTMTDSGGFQVFSLGDALGKGISKVLKPDQNDTRSSEDTVEHLKAKITEDGVEFKSAIDGSKHFFTPERSIEIQHDIGADIIFAFDECTSPLATREYQKEAMDRTHRWAKRSLTFHKKHPISKKQALFGIVQGGRFEDLREESARVIGGMDFDGFGIGGSFEKKDIQEVVGLVNNLLPSNKPRHLLGIGEPQDLILGIETGIDLFDCVAPTRIARNGQLYTRKGKINILNSKFREDMNEIDKGCHCYTCKNYTRSYLAHLFRAREIFGMTLASIHNVYFIVNLVKDTRNAILEDRLDIHKKEFFKQYKS